MPVTRNVPRLSAKSPSVRYLTRRGDTWRFQVRVPADLKKYLRIQHFRCSIGCMRIREASLKAKMLIVAVESVLSKVRAMAMQLEMNEAGGAADQDQADDAAFDLTPLAAAEWVGVMRGLGLMLDMSPLPAVEPDPYLDGLKRIVQLNREFKRGPIQSPYLLENSEHLLQAAIASMRDGVPASAPIARSDADERISALEDVMKAYQAFATENPKTTAPLSSIARFSEAADTYIATRIEANGGKESGDIHSIRFRASLFVELVGDRPVDEYGQADLQEFLNKLQYVPPNREIEALKGKSATQMIAMNKKHAYGVLALNTVKGHYLNDVKAIVALAASNANVENPFARAKLIFPKVFALPKRHKAPSPSRISAACLHGLASGKLHKAMMIPLGFFTGRRLGLSIGAEH